MKRSGTALRRSLLLLLILIIGGFTARWFYLHGKPEYLRDLPDTGPKRLITIRNGQIFWQDGYEGALTIYAQPVTGGPERVVGRDYFPGQALVGIAADGDSLFYLLGTPSRQAGDRQVPTGRFRGFGIGTRNLDFAGEYSTVRRLPLAGGSPQEIPLTACGQARNLYILKKNGASPPVEVKGRLYWTEARFDNSYSVAGSRLIKNELISANPDGSDRRRILDFTKLPGAAVSAYAGFRPVSLAAHRGQLYVIGEQPSRPGAEDRTPQHLLCRIRLNEPDVLQELWRFPAGFKDQLFFDGDYCYGMVPEHREHWFDWSQGGLTAKTATALYRLRLPD